MTEGHFWPLMICLVGRGGFLGRVMFFGPKNRRFWTKKLGCFGIWDQFTKLIANSGRSKLLAKFHPFLRSKMGENTPKCWIISEFEISFVNWSQIPKHPNIFDQFWSFLGFQNDQKWSKTKNPAPRVDCAQFFRKLKNWSQSTRGGPVQRKNLRFFRRPNFLSRRFLRRGTNQKVKISLHLV